MMTHIALLRGINVGGNVKVAMSDLRELLAEHGFGNVRTLLQSGNVVFSSDAPAGPSSSAGWRRRWPSGSTCASTS